MLLGNQISVKKYSCRLSVLEGNVSAQQSRFEAQKKDLEETAESVTESGRIFVRNLAYTVTEDDLRSEFEKVQQII